MSTQENISSPLQGAEARRVARNASAMAVARILTSALLFFWQIALTNALGDAQFGVYGTINALFVIAASFCNFGLSLIVIREVARNPAHSGKILSTTLFIQTITMGIAFVGMNIVPVVLGYPLDIRALTAVAALSLFADTFASMAYDQLLAHERMVIATVIDLAHIVLRIGISLLVLAAGYGLLGMYIVTVISGSLRAVIFWLFLTRQNIKPQFPLDRALLKSLLTAALPLMVAAFINLTYTQLDKLMSTSLLTEADTGHLSAAFVIVAGIVEVLSTTILVAIYPMLSRAYQGEGDNSVFQFIVEKLSYFTLLIGLPLGLIFTLFADAITVPLFGEDFRPSADILRILVWYAVITMVVNVYAQGMMSANRQVRYVGIRASGLAVKLILNLLLMTQIGVIGAAIASVIAELIVLIIVMRVDIFRFDHINWRWQRLLRLAVIGVITAIVMILLGTIHPILGIISAVFYIPAILWGRALAQDDYDLLYRLLAAVPGGSLILRFWKRDTSLNW